MRQPALAPPRKMPCPAAGEAVLAAGVGHGKLVVPHLGGVSLSSSGKELRKETEM